MSSLIKKLFGTLLEKPWEESQALIDNKHTGKTFGSLGANVVNYDKLIFTKLKFMWT